MVWFQCEDCGENMEKPKLKKHFSVCSATKLSCIDCGKMFGQESTVELHNQCMTEAEKYGRPSKGTTSNPKENSKQKIDFDRNVGLSTHQPWFCSLCNTKASSQQDLLAHANGKKHRAKEKAFHIAKQQQQSEQSSMDKKEKKRKLETFNGNKAIVQAGEKKSKRKKAKTQDHEKKQTELDSDFEYDKEDMKRLLVSYSKQELIYLIYKTVEKGSRLMSTILESAERDISQRNIIVSGFGWDRTHEYLKVAFESYGEIEECSVVIDKETGRSKGYGFVLFKTRKGAREALKNPEKRMYNRIVVCNLASANSCELDHGHVAETRHQQQTMERSRQNMSFNGHSQPRGFDPIYDGLRGNQMVAGLPNNCMFGSGAIESCGHGKTILW